MAVGDSEKGGMERSRENTKVVQLSHVHTGKELTGGQDTHLNDVFLTKKMKGDPNYKFTEI